MELPPAGRRGSFLLVALLLLIAVLLEQYWLVRLFPWLSDLGGVQPMIVFLDIPLRLPVIDWIPVGIIFLFFYLVVISPELSRQRQYRQQHIALHTSPSPSLGQKGWSVFTGWWLMLLCLAAGGGLYYLVEDQLPKQVRNGIDSFGIRADISIPWPGLDTVHLHGGMIMLITFLIGARFFLRRTRLPQPVFIPAPGSASVMTQFDSSETDLMPSRIVMRPSRPKPQPARQRSQTALTITPPTRTATPPDQTAAHQTLARQTAGHQTAEHQTAPDQKAPRQTTAQPTLTKSQAARTAQPAYQPYIQLPPEPKPAMVRPCVVTGVLEPS